MCGVSVIRLPELQFVIKDLPSKRRDRIFRRLAMQYAELLRTREDRSPTRLLLLVFATSAN